MRQNYIKGEGAVKNISRGEIVYFTETTEKRGKLSKNWIGLYLVKKVLEKDLKMYERQLT